MCLVPRMIAGECFAGDRAEQPAPAAILRGRREGRVTGRRQAKEPGEPPSLRGCQWEKPLGVCTAQNRRGYL